MANLIFKSINIKSLIMDEKLIWSIVFVSIVVLLCVLKPNTGRIFLGFFYLIMAIGVNLVNAVKNPLSTVQMGENSLLPFYRTFFSEVVSVAPVIFILLVVVFQITMGLLILGKNKNVKTGLIGTSLFLVWITPFGIIQIPWLGIAAVQIFLLGKEFDKSFLDIIVKKKKSDK